MLRIDDPKCEVGRFRGETDARIPLAQRLLLPQAIDCDSGNVGGDFSQSCLLRPRSAFFLAIHRERTQHLALGRKNWGRPAGIQPGDPRKIAVIGPERVRHHVGHHHRLARVHGRAAGTVARSDRRSIHRFHVNFW